MDNVKVAKELVRLAKVLVAVNYQSIPDKFLVNRPDIAWNQLSVDNDYISMLYHVRQGRSGVMQVVSWNPHNTYNSWSDVIKRKTLNLPSNMEKEFDKWVKDTWPNANIEK